MSAKTKWWYCGECGFPNHPRGQVKNSVGTWNGPPVHDNTKCEECGASADHDDARDREPS